MPEELEKIKSQAEEYLAGWKRAKADLVNYQRQVEKEKSDWFLFASAGCVKSMLPVVDSLEMAVQELLPERSPVQQGGVEGPSTSSGSNILGGIKKIRDQMLEALKSMGVEPIAVAKEPPNPELHEVVGTERVEDVASGLMAREVQRGYTLHGKVLRVAKVIVSE